MADKPFDRTVFNPLERPLTVDLNQLQSQSDATLRRLLMHELSFGNYGGTGPSYSIATGFIGNAFKVYADPSTALQVIVSAGVGFGIDAPATAIGGVVGVNDPEPYAPLVLSTNQTLVVPPNSSGSTRIDIIEVIADRRLENSLLRDVFNPITGRFDPGALNKTLAFDLLGRTGTVATPNPSTTGIGYKTGTPGSGVAPTTTSGYIKIANIVVPTGSGVLTRANVADWRPKLYPGGSGMVAGIITQVAGTTSAPVVTSLVMPPGMEVYPVSYSTNNESLILYLFPGGPSSACFASPGITAIDQAIPVEEPPVGGMRWYALASIANAVVDSGVVADIAGARVPAGWAKTVCLGESIIKVVYRCWAFDDLANTGTGGNTVTLPTTGTNTFRFQIPCWRNAN